jgi:nucleotide-binding universal stress UspA family protein
MKPRRIIVGIDLKPGGARALAWALLRTQEEACALHLVHVLTQSQLDATGALSASDKREHALSDIGRRLTSHAREAANHLLAEEGIDVDVLSLELSLEPRIVEGHATRSEQRVARAIAQVALDLDVAQIVIGRRGRPDSVYDQLAKFCSVESAAGEEPIRLLLRPGPELQKSPLWTATSEVPSAPARQAGPWRTPSGSGADSD